MWIRERWRCQSLTVDPRPAARIVDPAARRRALLTHPACAACGNPASNAHHLVSLAQRGCDTAANLVSLCGSGTSGCHGKVHANDEATRRAIRASLRDDQVEYIIGKKGQEWLNRRYPA